MSGHIYEIKMKNANFLMDKLSLTLFILMDYLMHIDTFISMEYSMMYFKGLPVVSRMKRVRNILYLILIRVYIVYLSIKTLRATHQVL